MLTVVMVLVLVFQTITVLYTIAIIGGELLFTVHHNYWLPVIIAWTFTVGSMMARRD